MDVGPVERAAFLMLAAWCLSLTGRLAVGVASDMVVLSLIALLTSPVQFIPLTRILSAINWK
jgi:hypothetical protein